MKLFERYLSRKPILKTEDEVATLIEDFVNGTGGDWDWGSFISTRFESEIINGAQNECLKVAQEFPPTGRIGWCNEQGLERLRAIASELRASGKGPNDPEVAFIKHLLPSVVVEPDTKPELGLKGPSYHICLPCPSGADYRFTLWLGSGEKQISARLLTAGEGLDFWYMPFEGAAFRSAEQLGKAFLETVELLVRHNTRVEQKRGVFFNHFKCEYESENGWKPVYGHSSARWIRAPRILGRRQVYQSPPLVGCI
jgi:hypothetical protein